MQWKSQENWSPRLAAFGVALLLGGSLAYWTLHWPGARSTNINIRAAQSELPQADEQAIARALGANSVANTATPTALAVSRLSLIGVLARAGGTGSAIIAVDDKPARSFAVGSVVDEGVVLKSVAPRKAVLARAADGASLQTLEMPVPAVPN